MYNKTSDLYGEFTVIESKGLYGLADKTGNVIFETKWDKIISFGNLLGIKENGKWGLLSLYVTVITPPQWDKL